MMLPSQFVAPTLQDLNIGEGGYVVPWAMSVDPDGSLWLNSHYTVHAEPRGTLSMFVVRREGGFEVCVSKAETHRWERSEYPCSGSWRGFRVLKFETVEPAMESGYNP